MLLLNNLTHVLLDYGLEMKFVFSIFFFFPFFLQVIVGLYIVGLPLRSWQTIGAPSVQGSAQCPFFRFWQLQDSNPRPADYHADVLPLRHFDPPIDV